MRKQIVAMCKKGDKGWRGAVMVNGVFTDTFDSAVTLGEVLNAIMTLGDAYDGEPNQLVLELKLASE